MLRVTLSVGLVLAVLLAVSVDFTEGGTVKYEVDRDRCLWKCARKGVHVECDPQVPFMAGLCGSGSDSDCNHDTYCPETTYNRVVVLCCSYKFKVVS